MDTLERALREIMGYAEKHGLTINVNRADIVVAEALSCNNTKYYTIILKNGLAFQLEKRPENQWLHIFRIGRKGVLLGRCTY